jgi:hypothetical protein
MAELSPQAQAVLNGFRAVPTLMDGPSIAGALRAAANQVVPEFWHEDNDIYGETMQDVRGQLLAIAAELESSSDT